MSQNTVENSPWHTASNPDITNGNFYYSLHLGDIFKFESILNYTLKINLFDKYFF